MRKTKNLLEWSSAEKVTHARGSWCWSSPRGRLGSCRPARLYLLVLGSPPLLLPPQLLLVVAALLALLLLAQLLLAPLLLRGDKQRA